MNLDETTQQFLKHLTDSFINNIQREISVHITQDIHRAITEFDVKSQLQKQIEETVNSAVTNYHWPNVVPNSNYNEDSVVKGIVAEFKSRTHEFLDTMVSAVQDDLRKLADDKLNDVNFVDVIRDRVTVQVSNNLSSYNFPANSIPGASIQPLGLQVHADNILPGIHKNFESTGIQDRATECQITILDQVTVVENRLVTNDLEIAGNATIRGNLNPEFMDRLVNATVSNIEHRYGEGTFDQYCDRVMTKINTDGLDSSRVMVSGKSIVENDTLAASVVNSNLQRVGALKELQVIGETLLDESLYVGNRRVGINTIDPERVLDIWDQEVQIVAGKKMKDVAYLGTVRNQTLIVGSANKDQLVVNPDGSVTIMNLTVGRMRHTSSPWQPTDNRPIGQIVWNEQPQIGAAIGWVSLGGARWARFGTISE
jgi:hypothetical protein